MYVHSQRSVLFLRLLRILAARFALAHRTDRSVAMDLLEA